jgi:hypothetical protein
LSARDFTIACEIPAGQAGKIGLARQKNDNTRASLDFDADIYRVARFLESYVITFFPVHPAIM